MREFLRKRGLLIIIIAILICVITVGSLYASGNRSSFITGAVNTVTYPIKKVMKAGVDGLEDIYSYLYKYDTLKEENERLAKENADLRAKQDEAEKALAENEEFRNMLGLDDSIISLAKVDANVTGWTSSNWNSTFTISQGTEDGIEVGDPVISSGGELVGQVSAVYDSWATVSSIVDTTISVGASTGGTSAIAKGDFELMQEGNLKLTNVPSSATLVEGDKVYTSGAGEKYPPDLVIGTIISVAKEESGLTSYAVIEPAADLGNLSAVFIITDYNYSD